ncbi:hypothetical protein [Natrinema sp. H-ect4]|jgi:ribosomal protein L31|uniref:hypothetical protein n=1 Tax=Natrinema sp. H-ect4 TaxID=3242699 RepID=UPI0035A92414
MVVCETCGDDVSKLFTHRIRSESMTHRRTRDVCASCHPFVSDSARPDRSTEKLVADGGTRAACPICSGTTVTDSGSFACVDCGWTSAR